MFKIGAYRLVHQTIGPRGLGQWSSLSSTNKAFGWEASAAAAAAAVAMTAFFYTNCFLFYPNLWNTRPLDPDTLSSFKCGLSLVAFISG